MSAGATFGAGLFGSGTFGQPEPTPVLNLDAPLWGCPTLGCPGTIYLLVNELVSGPPRVVRSACDTCDYVGEQHLHETFSDGRRPDLPPLHSARREPGAIALPWL